MNLQKGGEQQRRARGKEWGKACNKHQVKCINKHPSTRRVAVDSEVEREEEEMEVEEGEGKE